MSDLQAEKPRNRHIDLSKSVIPRSDFSHANLSAANLEGANLSGANFSMGLLIGANLSKAVLRGASFFHADLSNADLNGADISGANLKGAVLQNADLSFANLHNTDLQGADFAGAQNVSWHLLLEGRIDENTVIPGYLDENSLFEYLEQIFPNRNWREEFAGRIKDLVIELGKISDAVGEKSVARALTRLKVHIEHEDPGDA